MTKRLTPEQEAEVEAITSARCDKAAKIAATMLRHGFFDATATDPESTRAWWATKAGTRVPSERTWACVRRLLAPLQPVWDAADAVLKNADLSEDEPAVSLVSTEDLAAFRDALCGQRPVGNPPATVVKVPPDCGLETTCPECGGERVTTDPGWVEWFIAEEEWRRGRMPEFASPGTPEHDAFLTEHPYPQVPEEIPCEVCDGLGTVPTEIGEALLAFLIPRFVERKADS